MNSRHSANVTFDIQFGGQVSVGEFFTIDDRLITVSVAGRKRTSNLGNHPPLALAESIALELLREKVTAQAVTVPEHNSSWIESVTRHLINDPRHIVRVQVGA
jgi:hypothetical protein